MNTKYLERKLLCGVFEKVSGAFEMFFAEHRRRGRLCFFVRRFLFFILSAMLVFSVFSVMVRDVKCRNCVTGSIFDSHPTHE